MGHIERTLAKARQQKKTSEKVKSDISELVVGSNELKTEALSKIRLDPRLLRSNRIVTDDKAPASAAYKMLRTRVLQRMRRNDWNTIAVTGTCPGEGKTLTAINLAMSMARDVNTTTVLVDLDLRKPAISRYLGVRSKYGLTDCLQRDVPTEKIAVSPVGMDRLGLMLNDRSFPDSSELLTSPGMTELVQQLRQGEGRIVIFDLPPILATDDMLAFGPLVDSILLVVSQGTSKQEDLLAARELLQDINVVGTVLNRSSEDVAPYYYYGT